MKADHLTAFFLVFFLALALFGAGFVASIRRKVSSANLDSSDMPQPLSRVNSKASIIIGNAGHRALSERPELAILAMEAINSASNVEAFFLQLFVTLFGGNATIASKIYLALQIQSAKSVALIEAVNAMPNQEYAKIARALIALSKTNQKSRDKLAHHVWGVSPNLPDALLLLDPKVSIATGFSYDDVFVWTKHDFESLIQANDRLCGFGLTLEMILQGHIANKDGRLFDELMREPEIQAKVNLPA